VLYLDWYLDPSSPLTLPAMLVTLPRRAPLFVGAVSLSALAALAFAPLLLLVYAPLFFCWAWAVPGRDLDVGGDMRRIIHGAELLLYLRESYADPPAEYDEPAVTEQVLASPAALP
jgi:hypothetical protein